MQIPLILETFIDDDEKQKVKIWQNRKAIITDPPISTYFFSKRSLQFDAAPDVIETKERVKFLSDLKEHDVFRYTVPNVDYIKEINKSLNRPGLDSHQRIVNAVMENHTKFIDRILIDQPDFVMGYPNSEELIFFYFDIETLMNNYVDLKTITSIAFASNDRVVYSKQGEEREILEWFLDAMESVDPDVIVGYYMRDFDLVRIIERCKFHKLDYKRLARDRNVHYYKSERDRNVTMKIGGRALWDLMDSVMADQTLFGIKNRRMKTVCEFFGIEGEDWVKVSMVNSANDVDEDTLRAHNEDDIRRTYGLADVYVKNVLTLAEMFAVPLDYVVNNTQATLVGLFMGRELLKLNIRSDGMNRDRHPEIFNRPKAKGEKNYEAAYTDIYKYGLFKPVYKADFSGFYPSLEILLNLSPETTKILGYQPYQKEFRSETIGNKIIYHIPDKVINKTIVIGVKQDIDGFLRTELRRIREVRNEIKARYKNATPEEKEILNSRQWCLKIQQNAPSGLNGSSISRYGDIATTLVTVACGRELLHELKDFIDKDHPVAIEVDTDGVYTSEKPDMDEINKFLNDLIKKKFGVSESADISIDLDEYAAGYFIKQKNYILQSTEGNLIYHGVALKSSRQPKIFDAARDILCEALLNGKADNIKPAINKICNLDQYDLRDFTLRSTLHKPLKSYKKGSLQSKLGSQLKALGIPVEINTQTEYIKSKDGYVVIQAANSVKEIDREYYLNVIGKLATSLGMENEFKTRRLKTLDNWFE